MSVIKLTRMAVLVSGITTRWKVQGAEQQLSLGLMTPGRHWALWTGVQHAYRRGGQAVRSALFIGWVALGCLNRVREGVKNIQRGGGGTSKSTPLEFG